MRVLIVDDEPAARRKVARFLRMHGDADIVGECESGEDALRAIPEHSPDVVFLDIQMAGMSGLDVVEALAAEERVPAVIFATAHDNHAVKAFEVSAIDYLLKPFDKDRFDVALDRARQRVRPAANEAELLRLLEAMQPGTRYLRRLLVTHDERSQFVPTGDILRFEADRNYVTVHSKHGIFAIRATLESLERKLDPDQFVRVHRSHIVNLDAVKELQPWFHGDQKLVLTDGTDVMVSRRFASRLSQSGRIAGEFPV